MVSLKQVSDKKAREILDEASKKIKEATTIKIDFTFSETSPENEEINKQKGRLWLKGDKYLLRFAGQIIFCDGETKWTYIKEANEVHITNVSEDDDELANPLRLLDNYHKNFTVRWIREKTYNKKNVDVVDLYPKEENKAYHRVRMRINKQNSQIESTSIFYFNNTGHTIDIDRYRTNEPISDRQFRWNSRRYPDAEEIDLRI